METGKEAFDKPWFGETNGVVGEIMEPNVEDKVSMGHVSKDSEGDEVFEEAIEAEIPVVCVEEGVVHYSVEDGGNSNSRDDVENFEEAVEAHEIQRADDESNQKTDNWSEEPSVEKQGAYEIAAEDETEVVEQNSILEKDKGEVSDVADWEERKDLLHEPVDKSENGGPNHVNMRENQPLDDANETNPGAEDQVVHGKLDSLDTGARDQVVHGKLDTQDANEANGAANDLQNQVHSYKDALLRDEKHVDVIEPSAVQPEAGHRDSAGVHHYVSVTSGSVLRDERDIEKEGVHSLNLKPVNSDANNEEQRDLSNVDASANDHLGEKEVSSPAKIHGSIMDEEQIDAESKMPSLVPANCSSKDEEQQMDSEKTVASQPFYGSDKDEELRIDGENVVPSPEPVNGSKKDEEQQIDGEKEVPKPDPGNGSKKSEEEMDGEKVVPKSDPGIGNKKSEEEMDGEKAMASPEPVNLKNKGEKQINGPGYDADSTVQERSSPFKTEVIETEPTVQEYVVERDVPSSIATHQELKSDELPTMGSGNLNDKTNEQKYVSVSGTSSENHTGMSVRARPSAEDETSKSSETAAVAKSPSSSGVSATRAATPAGLGRAAPLLEPAPRAVQQPRVNGTPSASQNQLVEESVNGEAEEYDETREKLQMIRVKFLRLAYRLGQSTHNVVVAQVLYRLGLAEQLRGRNGSRVGAFSFDRASAMAKQLEAAGQEPLDFSCTIMVLGKTGVGKSATINSIFDEVKFGTDAFQMGTTKVQDVVGTVQGIKVRIIDTPGLLPSWSDQRQNEKILHSIKRFIKKTPPDIVLYLDRLDMQSRDYGDMPLLRTITEVFGPSIWFNAIVVLTHAASAPPEGPNGTVTSYDMYVTQRSHVVQQAIRQAAGDMRLMNPVSLVENHSACRTNPAGQRVLPNGQVWKPHLLLLSFASKILAEANTLLKLQDSPPGRPYATRTRSPPLPFLLSSLLQSKPQVKLPAEQFDDEDDTFDDDLDESSDSEDESEYDQLPPFKRLTKAQVAKLSKYQKKVYNDELEYREKLFMIKQLKEERKRRKMMKKMQAAAEALPTDPSENVDEETGGAASVPVPVPDLVLPASFDSDNPTHRYRYLDSSNQWLVRPVLEPNGWDHDVGYEGINVEKLFVVNDKIPISFSSQVSKDKKDANLQMEVASSVKHGVGKTTSLGFDMQSVGKDIAYTLRSETRFSNHRKNKVTAGLSTTLLGDVMTGGVKVEDKLTFNRRGMLVVSGGAMFGRGDVAYGGSLEATLRDKDHPLGRFLSTLGLSVMDWHGDLAIGCNSQTQIPIGRYTNLIGRVNINNKGSGQVSIRLNSSEQLQIALVSLIPLVQKLLSYSQPAQYG